jgi:hypothetical protein
MDFADPSSNIVQAESQNAPNLSFSSTPIFGNMNFGIQSPKTDTDVQPGFPAVPYVSLEALLFFQGMSNPMSAPYTIYGGSSAGQQVNQSSLTQQDVSGTSRYFQGFQSGNAGSGTSA